MIIMIICCPLRCRCQVLQMAHLLRVVLPHNLKLLVVLRHEPLYPHSGCVPRFIGCNCHGLLPTLVCQVLS